MPANRIESNRDSRSRSRTGRRLASPVPRDVRGDLGEREGDGRAGPRGVLHEVEADLPLQETHLGRFRDPVLGVDGEEEGADVYVVALLGCQIDVSVVCLFIHS